MFGFLKKQEPVIKIERVMVKEYIPFIFNKIDIKEGDIIVLETSENLPPEAWNNIKDSLKSIWPNNKILIFEGGMKLKVGEEIIPK